MKPQEESSPTQTPRIEPWWRRLTRDTLQQDLLAGLTGAVIVLPQSVALALLAGLPVEYGLYTAIVPVIIAALFGSSHHLVSGPTTAISIVVFATLAPLATPGSESYITLALTLTLAVGLFQVALGVARLGALVNFISHTVIVGFTAGAAILIVTSQLQHIFGVWLPRNEPFLTTWSQVLEKLPQSNLHTLAITFATLISAALFGRFLPRWPNLLLAMLVGALLGFLLGGEVTGIHLVGALPSSLPPLSLPDFSLQTWQQITSGALAIAILGLMEAVSIARSIANQSHQRHNANQEFIGQGLSNIVGSLFSSYASSGSFTRSGLNYRAGARSPLAAVFSAIAIAVIVLTMSPLAAYLPVASVAAILLLVAWKLIDFHNIIVILKASRSDAAVLVTTFIATLLVDLTFAVYVGVMLSLVLHLIRISHPTIVSRVPDPEDSNRRFITAPRRQECPQLKIIRIDGSLFFGSASDIEESLQNIELFNPEQKRVLIICSGVNFIDITGAELLKREVERRREMGGDLYLCSVKPGVLEILRKGGYLETIGMDHIFASKALAIHQIFAALDHERCKRCNVRAFSECSSCN
jgi:SulP family sulfate permease